ncbi:LysE family translocator [Burkholderia gladioli]|jgi:threonine/homoserine/homoserine lactone efflux protein|uniref:LysE type translocator family protein n=1 Tax=Burkholderia gladioli TaxID=28095 RepID=A0AAW3ENT3_BURGA|nr:LysE family translocator [Burkholderia gladioli]AJW99007.1 lysE type translocator family protein [Burkholderia gladioli]ASD79485.1 LysE family translocator [Burkholderia gladioli pv. gladioli]AWY55271.1 LysE family translocator [Burkholderia gladioli pv. gladioli]KGC09223.1 lysE type translocator family protein [Burkholderia gladioli]MBA1361895.1 LysE family translocator [Burkholderia gladioli]
MTFSTLLVFSLVMLAGIATPGPTVLLALSNASHFGLRRASFGMAGALAADLLLVTLVALGLGAVLAASETLFVALKWLGAAWLAYVGWRLLRASGQAAGPDPERVAPARRALFLRSFFIAMSNPKYYLFMTALLPQFVDRGQPVAAQYFALGLTVGALDVVVMTAYALIGIRSVALFRERGVRWMNRISGGMLLLLAGSVALYRRGTH